MTAKLLLIGPFPPPVHGFAVITKAFHAKIGEKLTTRTVNIAVPEYDFRLLYHTLRTLRCLWSCLVLIGWWLGGGRAVYIGCNDGHGMLYIALQICVARLLQKTMFLHHHSFEYIVVKRRTMRLMQFVGGRKLTHIFLCEAMRDNFQEQYGPVSGIVLDNSLFVPIPDHVAPRTRSDEVVIGFLSNLTPEKGLYAFLDLVREAARAPLASGMRVRGLLAGPAQAAKDKAAIEAAVADQDVPLEWLGGVYGDARDRFYRDIDVFMFPTFYRTEAQPTVVFEAMSHGRPVIARGLGCIPTQLPERRGVICPDAEFVPSALEWLAEYAASDQALDANQHQAHQDFLEIHTRADRTIDEIVDRVTAS